MLGAATNSQTAMLYGLFGPRLSSVKLQSRQRPRKGVRLGQRKRSAPDVWRDPYAGMVDYWYGTPFAAEKVGR